MHAVATSNTLKDVSSSALGPRLGTSAKLTFSSSEVPSLGLRNSGLNNTLHPLGIKSELHYLNKIYLC